MRQVFRSSDEFLVIDEASFWDECLWTDTNIFLCYDNFFSRLKPIWFQPAPAGAWRQLWQRGGDRTDPQPPSYGHRGWRRWHQALEHSDIQPHPPQDYQVIFQGGNSLLGFSCESLVLWQKRANHSFAIFKRVCSRSLRKERQKRFAPIALFKKATRAKKPSTRANSQPCIFQT